MIVGKPDINLPQMEAEILADWQTKRTFYKSNDIRKGKKEFTFYDGPPFANGLPHYGHMLGQTLKDTVPRYWNMCGYFVERRFGWDCHGLPVEYEVEKQKKLNGRKDILALGIATFNDYCQKTVLHYTKEWQRTVSRLGRWVDWENEYRTMDKNFMESVWWVLSELYKKNLVYKDLKVVAYSPRISAVVSNFEANLNYKDIQDPSVTIKFKLKDENASILAWTTTPWTLVSNLGLIISAKIKYAKVRDKKSGEVFYAAKERLSFVYKSEDDYEVLEQSLTSDKLAGRSYEPLFPYFRNHANAFRVLVDDFVTTDSGTGVVHAAPAFGEDDFRVCRKENIKIIDPLDDEGAFTAQIPELVGINFKEADKSIIKMLKEKGALFRHETLVHSYPHCDRTEGPLIYRAIPTWYVAVEKIKDRLIANNQLINWVPEHLRDGRMGNWLENARDWAISRNRFWGTPIPVWLCDKDENHRVVIGSVGELEKLTNTKIDNLHKQFIDPLTFACQQCSGKMQRIPEVFDCWFESGSMPYAQKHYPFEHVQTFKDNFPADYIAEGLDQTRGWFYTLSILGTALFDKPAFKNVIVNGIVLAEDGKKMSKRLGNYTPPDKLLDQFGADSVRLYMLNSSVIRGEDLRFSDAGVKETTRAVILPLWNAFSFLSTYAEADAWRAPERLLANKLPQSKHEMDRWIMSRLQSLLASIHEHMCSYKLYLVVPETVEFINDLTNWYIRLSRRRFWGGNSPSEKEAKEQAYETLFYVLLTFTKVLAPFTPFITDRIYRNLAHGIQGAKESVHLNDMPVANKELVDEELEERMQLVRKVTNLGRSLRAKYQLKTRQVLSAMTVITSDAKDKAVIEHFTELLREELNVKEIHFSTDEAAFVKLTLKPNFKTLGKKLGKDLHKFQKHLTTISASAQETQDFIARLTKDKFIKVWEYELLPEDFLIERGSKDEKSLVASEQDLSIVLDTALNEALILEGLSREVINRVQRFRKDVNLNVSDRIDLGFFSADAQLATAAQTHAQVISDETLATKFAITKDKNEFMAKQFIHKNEFEIDGSSCFIGLSIS